MAAHEQFIVLASDKLQRADLFPAGYEVNLTPGASSSLDQKLVKREFIPSQVQSGILSDDSLYLSTPNVKIEPEFEFDDQSWKWALSSSDSDLGSNLKQDSLKTSIPQILTSGMKTDLKNEGSITYELVGQLLTDPNDDQSHSLDTSAIESKNQINSKSLDFVEYFDEHYIACNNHSSLVDKEKLKAQSVRKTEQSKVYYDSRICLKDVKVNLVDIFQKMKKIQKRFPFSKRVHFPQRTSKQSSTTTEIQRMIQKNPEQYHCSKFSAEFGRRNSLRDHVAIHATQKLQCKFCTLKFEKSNDFKIHLKKAHADKESLVCGICSTEFKTSVALYHHFKLDHSNMQSFKCSVCHKIFTKYGLLRQHIIGVHNDVKPYGCSLCSAKFTQNSAVKTHIHSMHLKDKRFKCHLCSKTFSQGGGLNFHVKSVHLQERPHKCSVCSKAFKKSQALKWHLSSVHNKEKPFSCNICSNKFARRENLVEHLNSVHKNDRPYSCQNCHLSFKVKNSLRKHMATHVKERLFKCDHCSLRFPTKRNLKYHLVVHSKERPFNCRACSLTFKCSRGLKSHFNNCHLVSDHNILVFECDHCRKKFKNKVLLKRHVERHTTKLLNCRDCLKKFKSTRNLRVHERIHKNERPYKCNICSKTFVQSGSLVLHLRIHSNDKPYKCNDCPKAYFQKRGLEFHIISAHDFENKFHCKLCTAKFKNKFHLNLHSKTDHENKRSKCEL